MRSLPFMETVLSLFADAVVEVHRSNSFEWDLLHIFIAFLIVLGAVIIVGIVVKAMGWTIPQWVIQIVTVVVVVVVGIIALKFLWSLF